MQNTRTSVAPSVSPPDTERLPLHVVERNGSAAVRPRGAFTRRLLLAALAASIAIALWFTPALRNRLWPAETAAQSQQQAASAAPLGVFALGRLRPAGEVITVAAPFGAGDARIIELRVKEGSTVKAGDILAVLDSKSWLEATRDSARAQLNVQRALLEQTRFTVEANRSDAEATLRNAREAQEIALLDYNRTAKLHVRGVASNALLDQKQSVLDQARLAVTRAEINLARFDDRNLPGKQEILVAESRLAAAEADVRRAEQDVEKSLVRAPSDGTILTLTSHVGERPSQNGIATLGDLSRMIAEVDVYQSNISQVQLGQSATITSEALGAPLDGTVTFIGLEVRRQTAIDSNPAANTDARVVEVHVTLDSDSNLRAKALTNLQVTAHINSGAQP